MSNSMSKTLSSVRKTKQFNKLIEAGLNFVSTDRQLANGTLAFSGKMKAGRKTIRPSFSITASGNVISNGFVARKVAASNQSATYRAGLAAASELLEKRLAV